MARNAMPPGRRGGAKGGKQGPLVPPMKGGPPAGSPRPVRGRVALAVPAVVVTRRRMGPPPPTRTPPPRMAPPPAGRVAPETPRAERLEAPPPPRRPSSTAPIMQQRGARQTMAAMRRGQVPF